MTFKQKVLVGALITWRVGTVIPSYLMETVVKASFLDWLKPLAFRN